jgi:hypothetical protein
MSGLFVVLIGMGLLSMALTLTVAESRRRWFLPPALALLPMAARPILVRFDMRGIRAMGENPQVLEVLSLLMIAEALLSLWTGMEIIVHHYEGKALPLRARIFFLPSAAGAVGAVWVAYAALYRYPGAAHGTVMAWAGGGVGLAVAAAGLASGWLLKDWGERMEIKMTLMMVQLLVAAFIPAMLRPVAALGAPPPHSMGRLGVFALTLVAAGACGHAWNRWQSLREWRRHGICE